MGIIGTGWVVQTIHLPYFLQNDQISRIYLFDIDHNQVKLLTGLDSRIDYISSLEEMLADQEINLIVISTPNFLHAKQIRKALSAGKIVFCEKPICINKDEVSEMETLINLYPNRLYACLPNRFREDINVIRELLVEKKLGEIYRIRASWLRSNGIPRTNWFLEREKSGGGVLIDLGSHLIDLLLWLLDFPTPKNISAISHDYFLKKPNKFAEWHGRFINFEKVYSNVEDNISAFITFAEGMSCSIDLGWAGHNLHDETVIEIYGDHGHLKLNTLFGFSNNTNQEKSQLTTTYNSIQKIQEFDLKDRRKPYVKMLDYYLSCILNKNEQELSSFNALTSIKIIDYIYNMNDDRSVKDDCFSTRF